MAPRLHAATLLFALAWCAGAGAAEPRPADPRPLPTPRADEQEPRPFFPERTGGPSRKVVVGPEAGVVAPTSSDPDRATYGASPTWGVRVRIEIAPWLGVAAGYRRSTHPVQVADDGLGNPETRYDLGGLDVDTLEARVEPTWVLTPRLRAWAGLGVGWSRLSVADFALEQRSSSGTRLELTGQTGVLLEYPLELGASFDVVRDWAALSLVVFGAPLSNQTGALFEASQGVDQNGALVGVGGMPELSATFGATVGLGIIL